MISHKIAVHQLIDVCTTRVVHVHISCWTTAQQLLCDRRTYIFRRHHLNIPTTSIISFTCNSKAQNILNREDFADCIEGEVLIIHYHIILPLLFAHILYLGKHLYRNYHLSTIGQENCHCSTFHIEI